MTHPYQGEERRSQEDSCGRRDHCPMMEDSAIEEIAEKAAEKAIEKLTAHVYQEIGRGLVSKIIWMSGVVVVGVWLWLNKVPK